jgi:hypothetical protein
MVWLFSLLAMKTILTKMGPWKELDCKRGWVRVSISSFQNTESGLIALKSSG